MGAPEPAFTQRASGVLVPTSQKQNYTLPQRDFVKLRRMMAFAREYDLVAVYGCARCGQQVNLVQKDRIVTDDDPAVQGGTADARGGRFRLECACSVWEVR